MKKIYRILIIIALGMLGCDKIKEANTITFEPTFSTDLNCTVSGSGKAPLSLTFSSSGQIDPQDNADVKKYLSKIQGYQILSVTGTITSISPNNANLVTGSIVINNSQYTTQWGVQNIPLVVGQSVTLGNTMGEWDKVSKILKDAQKFTVTASGETDKGGIVFTIAIKIKAKATANAI
jgi:hypothetical protein